MRKIQSHQEKVEQQKRDLMGEKDRIQRVCNCYLFFILISLFT